MADISQPITAPRYSDNAHLPGHVIHKTYFYHDIRIVCQTNQHALLAILDSVAGMFPLPGTVRGEVAYSLFCYTRSEDFPLPLPRVRQRVETLQLVTQTTMKCYSSMDHMTIYQHFLPQPALHAEVLTVLHPTHHSALTQIELPDPDDGDHHRLDDTQNIESMYSFLRRYVVLMALGELLRIYGFEPCHAAAITAPWDDQQGMLLLGDSGSGKTTTSLGCALAGCGLLGDDLVLLHEDEGAIGSTISAYTLLPDVSIRTPSLAFWPELAFLHAYPADQRDKRFCTIDQLRPGAARLSTRIRFMLFTTLSDEGQSSLLPLNKATTLRELIRLCISKEHGNTRPELQQRQFLLLTALAQQTQGYQLRVARGDHSSTRLVHSLFAGGPDD